MLENKEINISVDNSNKKVHTYIHTLLKIISNFVDKFYYGLYIKPSPFHDVKINLGKGLII